MDSPFEDSRSSKARGAAKLLFSFQRSGCVVDTLEQFAERSIFFSESKVIFEQGICRDPE